MKEKKEGFTLMEVIIALAILGLVVIAFTSILSCASMIQKSSNNITMVNNKTATAIHNKTSTNSTGSIVWQIGGGTSNTVNGTFYTGGTDTVDTYKVFRPTGWSY